MTQALQRAWRRRGTLASLLYPVSLLYRALAALHRGAYAIGLRRVTRLPVPVVVVGNVVAGGAGKTPVVLAVVEHLRARGLRCGVISRGYGRSDRGCTEVRPGADPVRVGDEPLLLRRKADVPVYVGARRAEAARALLAAYPDTQVIVSDDGLQHHGLARDVEIVVFDARGTGNGWLLPAGPLREPWPRRADLVLRHGDPPGIKGHAMERSLSPEALRGDGTRKQVNRVGPPPVHALAGIANPDSFFEMLRAAGLQLEGTHAYPDHHDFGSGPLPRAATLVCTEKDAVKLWRLHPGAWTVPLQVTIPDDFWRAFDRLLDARLSSKNGSAPS